MPFLHFLTETSSIRTHTDIDLISDGLMSCRVTENELFESTDIIPNNFNFDEECFRVDTCKDNFHRYAALIDFSKEQQSFTNRGRNYNEFYSAFKNV